MKYVVDVNGERLEITLGPEGVQVGDDVLHCHLADVEGTPVHLVTVGRAVHRVVARRGATRGAYTLWIDGHRFVAEALDERTRTIRDLTASAVRDTGPKPLIAPMPGLIVRVHVQPGDRVEAGQGLVVMEAMKMENELRTLSAGTVLTVRANAGMAVEKGSILIELGA
jgi:pyruvate carboxylase subunit B